MESDSTVAELCHLPHLRWSSNCRFWYKYARSRTMVTRGNVRPSRWKEGGREGNKNLDTAVDNRRSNTISPVYCACTELGDIFQQLFPARVIPSTIYGFASLPLRLRTDLLDFSLHGSMRSRHFHLFARHAERRITISAND